MIANTLRSNLMILARAYAKATNMRLPQVSKKFYGNVAFFDDFATDECSISIKKYGEVVEAIRDAWPPESEWPTLRALIIARPVRQG